MGIQHYRYYSGVCFQIWHKREVYVSYYIVNIFVSVSFMDLVVFIYIKYYYFSQAWMNWCPLWIFFNIYIILWLFNWTICTGVLYGSFVFKYKYLVLMCPLWIFSGISNTYILGIYYLVRWKAVTQEKLRNTHLFCIHTFEVFLLASC